MQALKDFATKQDAIDYPAIRTGFISANSMNSQLAQKNLTRAMQIISETDGHPAQDAMLSFFDPRSTEYNFIIGDETGDAQIALLDSLIAAGAALDTIVGGTTIAVATKFAELKPILIQKCNKPYQPYKNITDHQWQLAKETITRTPITATNGLVSITTSVDVEAHAPQIYQLVNGVYYKRVAGFPTISTAGVYHAQCPQLNNLYVDDAYGLFV